MTAARRLPGSLNTNRRLDRWLRFNEDRTVTVATGKVEIGQGIVTALAQMAAEELDVPIEKLRFVSGDTSLTPNEGQSSASRSINEGGIALRHACAQARHLLLHEAARRLGVPPARLSVDDGVISGPDGASISYWDLPHAALLDRDASVVAQPKPPDSHRIVGSNVGRLDIPDKVRGKPRFVQDMELPGMLFGRVVRPPSAGATLRGFDAERVRALPGVLAVVCDGNFIGVVAQREEQAVKARLVAIGAAQWDESSCPTDDAGIYDYLLSRATQDETVPGRSSPDASKQGERRFEACYKKPYLAHASIGPSCALARCEGGRVELWTHSQGVFPLQEELALVLDMPAEHIQVHHVEGSGCYGHNGADDVALDAILLSRAVAGRPVQVQWMRDDEFAWEPYGPAMVMKTSAALNDDGDIVDWTMDVWSNGHIHRPGSTPGAGRVTSLLAAWHIAEPIPRAPQADACLSDAPGSGCTGRNLLPLYDFANQNAVIHQVRELPVRVSSHRSTGAYGNVFAIESFVDELAGIAGADPVEYRLRHLSDARARAVIELAAQKAGWRPRIESDGTWGRGIAFAQHRNRFGYFAIVIELATDPDLRVARAVAAIDVGQAVNPDGVINQIEGGIIQSISWTLKEQVRFDARRITTRTWEDYPILTFPEVPRVEVHLITRPGEEPLGAGEAPMGPTAAAIANALHHAMGVRVRELPITREHVLAACERQPG
jgi:CO/xanthine dehydrogenase Mo-binding subunit